GAVEVSLRAAVSGAGALVADGSVVVIPGSTVGLRLRLGEPLVADLGASVDSTSAVDSAGHIAPAPPPGFGPASELVDSMPEVLAAADLDSDGNVDIAYARADKDALEILRGRGDGTFAGAYDVACGGRGVTGIALVDIDRDGRLDAVASLTDAAG